MLMIIMNIIKSMVKEILRIMKILGKQLIKIKNLNMILTKNHQVKMKILYLKKIMKSILTKRYIKVKASFK